MLAYRRERGEYPALPEYLVRFTEVTETLLLYFLPLLYVWQGDEGCDLLPLPFPKHMAEICVFL